MPADIAYVKFVSNENLTAAVTPSTQGCWARYEVVNIGTAPTDDEHTIGYGVSLEGTVMYTETHRFSPPLEPNGGSYQGTIHIAPDHLRFEGNWELWIQCDLGINKGISDEVSMPFTVSHHDS